MCLRIRLAISPVFCIHPIVQGERLYDVHLCPVSTLSLALIDAENECQGFKAKSRFVGNAVLRKLELSVCLAQDISARVKRRASLRKNLKWREGGGDLGTCHVLLRNWSSFSLPLFCLFEDSIWFLKAFPRHSKGFVPSLQVHQRFP